MKLLLLGALLVTSFPALAQAWQVSGVVTDNGVPVAGITITATESSSPSLTKTTVTGESGTYEITLPAGRWTLTARAEGYEGATSNISLTELAVGSISVDFAVSNIAARAKREADAARAEREAAAARVQREADAVIARNKRAADAEADRKRKVAEAEADRKRKEAQPLVRVTELQARSMLNEASLRAHDDVTAFSAAFMSASAKLAPEFNGPVEISTQAGLRLLVTAPLSAFFGEARERVRKFEPLNPPPMWTSGIRVLVIPERIDAPDIEKVVVQRNGTIVPPLRTALTPREMVTALGAKRMIHGGEVVYPLNAFEPGAGVLVTVTAIPASGNNISRAFESIELRAIQ